MSGALIRSAVGSFLMLVAFIGPARPGNASDILIELWSKADARCTAAKGESAVTAACEQRDLLAGRLMQMNLCYSFAPAAGSGSHWQACQDAGATQGAAGRCVVADPSPTPLNIRTQPYGAIIGTIANGSRVDIVEEKLDQTANTWAYIVGAKPLGWAYKKFLRCAVH